MKKKSTFTKILLGLALVIVVFLVVVAFQPPHYHVQQSKRISALPSAVFPQVNVLKNWEAWNPWMKLDKNMKISYEGPPSGVGAVYTWKGNMEVGEGRMTIVEVRADEMVRFKLEFVKPMAGTSQSEITFKRQGDETEVTWAMDGENNLLSKAFSLFVSMDKMIGKSFEEGLDSMKRIVESAPKP